MAVRYEEERNVVRNGVSPDKVLSKWLIREQLHPWRSNFFSCLAGLR